MVELEPLGYHWVG